MKKLLVIDGNSILNRQFYGIRPLTTSQGLFTNAVYGFLNVLLLQLEKIQPDYCAIAFDVHAKTFRHLKYDAYKAGRHETPKELLMQFPYAKKLATAMGISVIEREGYEADDVLGTLSALATQAGVQSYLLTGDRDALQLINDNCTVLLATNADTLSMDRAAFFEKYTIMPEQFVDLKALMGDSSDNIPGVAGVGEKTAIKLISTAGSLDGVYSDISALGLSPKMVQKLVDGKENAYLSQWLAKILTDAPLGLTLEDVCRKPISADELDELLCELEFSAMRARVMPTAPKKEEKLTCVLPGELEDMDLGDKVAIHLEENSIFVYNGDSTFKADFDDLATLAGFFAKNSQNFCVHDIKELLHTLSLADIAEIGCKMDVMLAAYTVNAGDGKFDIERLSQTYLGAPLDENGEAKAIFELEKVLGERLEKDGISDLYYSIEQPLAYVLFRMEKRGFLIDLAELAAFGERLKEDIARYEAQIYELAGKKFNINSPKQLGVVLFEDLELPTFKKTKSGYSTNVEVMEKLRPYHPIIDLILDYRQVAKLSSTYVEGLSKVADENGKIHTRFKQTGTVTGRLSSAEPNLQNIPIRTELGRQMRNFFVASKGNVLVDADYSQIELRLLAAIAKDPVMISAFREGFDIHSITAMQVFGVDEAGVTFELRKRAKAVNFGIVYGMGDYSLSQDLGVTKKEAAQYIEGYKNTYKGVDEYLKRTVQEAYDNGYVKTILSRRRYIPELASGKAMERAFGERVAMNSPIQGSAADIIKLAMINVERALIRSDLDARLILQVHDELIVECREEDAQEVLKILKDEMEGAASLAVSLVAEAAIGKNWAECH